MNSTRKQGDLPKKYHVDPGIMDKLIKLYNQQVETILEISTKKCDPHELQYSMSRAAGFQQAIHYIIMNMTEETKDGITLLKTGQRAFTSTTCGGGTGTEDRGDTECPGQGTDRVSTGRDRGLAQPKPSDSRKRWRRWW